MPIIGGNNSFFKREFKENKSDATFYINSGKISQQGHYEFFDQYKTDSDFDSHKGNFAVQLAPLAPQFEKFACLLMIFKGTSKGFEYQESRGGHELDDITRAFGERMERVVQ